MTNSGGVSAHVDFGALKLLRVYGMAVGQSTNIKINMRRRLVETKGLGTRTEEANYSNCMVGRATVEDGDALETSEMTSVLRMRLTGLKCYRLPGETSRITSWP